MAQSFFDLTPPAPAPDEDVAYIASLTSAEHEIFAEQTHALAVVLQDALEAYCAAHPETTMAVCLNAAKCLVYCLIEQANTEAADA